MSDSELDKVAYKFAESESAGITDKKILYALNKGVKRGALSLLATLEDSINTKDISARQLLAIAKKYCGE